MPCGLIHSHVLSSRPPDNIIFELFLDRSHDSHLTDERNNGSCFSVCATEREIETNNWRGETREGDSYRLSNVADQAPKFETCKQTR